MASHAVAVAILSPEGVPLVRDPKKPIPRYWKLPGGRSLAAETPEDCAVREVLEETGLKVSMDSLTLIEAEDKKTHILTFFKAELPSLKRMRSVGNESEEIRSFSLTDALALPDLFPNHKRILSRLS